ncbi:beta-1,3-galactosyltransferase 5-like [Ylistrum balloti]|uniref:beta-1,3-galactosyltransferase 5-like n=1 Tax=Ylistrum balloti TaxID=509963 RepID=UPI0029058FB1|nr:beta-1,3-galactosyltransferase 5-like [Ylistrum balloti]
MLVDNLEGCYVFYCRAVRRPTRRRVGGVMFVGAVLMVWLFFSQAIHEQTLTLPNLLKFAYQQESLKPIPFSLVPNLKCPKNSTRNIVIMVLSKMSNIVTRHAIRRTWGNREMQIKYNFSMYFVVGREEGVSLNNDNGDLLQVDVDEDYNNLTYKTIAAFNWVVHYCQGTRHFFKIDDDVYLDLDILSKIQRDANYVPDYAILGSCNQISFPCRKSSKWQISYEEYPFQILPPFCNGPGYVMTLNTARKIYDEMRNTRVFKYEDVYVGIVAYKLGLSVKNVDNFVYNMNIYVYDWLFSDLFSRCHIITHYVSPGTVQQYWDRRTTFGKDKNDCSIWGIGKFILSYIV